MSACKTLSTRQEHYFYTPKVSNVPSVEEEGIHLHAKYLPEQDAKGIDICGKGDGILKDELRRHVGQGAMLHGACMILPWPHEHAQPKVRHLRSTARGQQGSGRLGNATQGEPYGCHIMESGGM